MSETLHRFDTVPVDIVATLDGTRCRNHSKCGLICGHDGPCADVSPAGLVHNLLAELGITKAEKDALSAMKEAYADAQDAIDDAESLASRLRRDGPPRIRKMLDRRFSYANLDWPVIDDEDEWAEDLDGFGATS